MAATDKTAHICAIEWFGVAETILHGYVGHTSAASPQSSTTSNVCSILFSTINRWLPFYWSVCYMRRVTLARPPIARCLYARVCCVRIRIVVVMLAFLTRRSMKMWAYRIGYISVIEQIVIERENNASPSHTRPDTQTQTQYTRSLPAILARKQENYTGRACLSTQYCCGNEYEMFKFCKSTNV